MPTVFIAGYKFRFYSSDVHEPAHIHVIHDDNEAKIWLDPVSLAANHGFRSHELTEIESLVEQHRTDILEAWNDHFSPP